MLHQYNTEALDCYLKVLMNNDLLFGGKIVIVLVMEGKHYLLYGMGPIQTLLIQLFSILSYGLMWNNLNYQRICVFGAY